VTASRSRREGERRARNAAPAFGASSKWFPGTLEATGRSTQGLHAELRDTGSPIGLATVYRALSDLAVEGEADSLQSPEGENLYRACTPGTHHHHLICRNCGLTIEIEADEVEAWARSVASQHGFTEAKHVVDVFGLCENCSAAAQRA
jgi:Fur family ferric uptake transcriptional regulator